MPKELGRVSNGLVKECLQVLDPLLVLGLGYLQLDRAGSTLSTGERQRLELTSTVRANTTGMLYVLDEPSVGLHPSNIEGLRTTIEMLAANGNSVVMVEHEIEIINAADWVIELGPGAGAHGGTVVAQGTPADIRVSDDSIIGPYLAGRPAVRREPRPTDGEAVIVEVADLYNLHDVRASFPERAMTAVAGPSGAGKTALVAGEPGARAARQPGGREDAEARPTADRGRDPRAGRDRRDADRPELPVDAGHVLRRVRRNQAGVRGHAAGAPPPVEAGALLLQHQGRPVPRVRGARARRHRRAVPAGHPRGLPAVPRQRAIGRRCSTYASTG